MTTPQASNKLLNSLKRMRKSIGSLDKPAEKSVKLDVCVTCAKNVTDDAIECFWCKEWEHWSCANIKTNEYVLLDGASDNILFFL